MSAILVISRHFRRELCDECQRLPAEVACTIGPPAVRCREGLSLLPAEGPVLRRYERDAVAVVALVAFLAYFAALA